MIVSTFKTLSRLENVVKLSLTLPGFSGLFGNSQFREYIAPIGRQLQPQSFGNNHRYIKWPRMSNVNVTFSFYILTGHPTFCRIFYGTTFCCENLYEVYDAELVVMLNGKYRSFEDVHDHYRILCA